MNNSKKQKYWYTQKDVESTSGVHKVKSEQEKRSYDFS